MSLHVPNPTAPHRPIPSIAEIDALAIAYFNGDAGAGEAITNAYVDAYFLTEYLSRLCGSVETRAKAIERQALREAPAPSLQSPAAQSEPSSLRQEDSGEAETASPQTRGQYGSEAFSKFFSATK